MSKLNIIVIFGGKSAEHEVSIKSAINIMAHINKNKYNIFPIWVNKLGKWFYIKNDISNLLDEHSIKNAKKSQVVLISNNNPILFDIEHMKPFSDIHLAFPIIHGPTGEDGTIQGFLSTLQVPYVGSKVLGSAICMDKVITKEILSKNQIKTPKYIYFYNYEKDSIRYEEVVNKLKLPIFIKPASLGSSIGISKVEKESDFLDAIEIAFHYDSKIIIEEYVEAREIECAVLGNKNDNIIVSNPGEIITTKSFYTYEAKYSDASTKLKIPAELDNNIINIAKAIALEAYNVLCCEDYARVDMFLDTTGTIFINEINTIPGFTEVSMYPLLMETAGIGFDKLVERLLEYALTKEY